MTDTFEVIEAFVDRERVDAEALKTALASEEGRDYLVDLLAMRELVMDQADVAPAEVARDAQGQRRPSWVGFTMAAAASLVLGLTGYQWGVHNTRTQSAGTSAIVAGPVSAAAPAPTSVIVLEPGVDWHQVMAN